MRRLLRTLLALVVVLVVSVVIAPVGSAAFALGDCKNTPQVEDPGQGLVSSLDSKVTATGDARQGTAATPYGTYGYAGMTWQTYDLGCGGDARDPVTAMTTWVANELFNIAKAEVALFNGLHYALSDAASFAWLDQLTSSLSSTLFNGIFVPWVGLALLVLAVLLFGYAARADFAGLSRRAAWGLVALTFAAGTASTPLVFETFVRSTVIDLSNDAANGMLSDATSRDAVPDYLVNSVIYPAWVAGEFGSPTSTIAQQNATKLLDAKACTKDQAATTCNRDRKKDDFKKVASNIGDAKGDGGAAYDVLQGRSESRPSAAAKALTSATIATSFQIVALAILILSVLTVAVMVLLGGVVGLLAVVNPDTMRNVFRVFGTALINAVVMAVLAGIHARMVLWVTSQPGIPWILQELGLALFTVLLLMIAQPVKRAKTMLHAVLDTVGGTGSVSGMLGRRGSERPATGAQRVEKEIHDQQSAEPAPAGDVPEAAPPIVYQRVDPDPGPGGGAAQAVAARATGWALNATPQGRAALIAADGYRQIQGAITGHTDPDSGAGSGPDTSTPASLDGPPRAPAGIGTGTVPLSYARSDDPRDDWYRPDGDELPPDLSGEFRTGRGAAVITDAPVEDFYRRASSPNDADEGADLVGADR
jgi:hypothetical protein